MALLPTTANAATSAISQDGAFHRVTEGLYMELFPDGSATAPWNSVLALERTDATGTHRFLVPGSEDISIDSRASLVVDGNGVFVLWVSSRGNAHSELDLVHFDGVGFGVPYELSGDPQQLKGPPRVGVTRDAYPLERPDGTFENVQRTTLHLVWWEESAAASLDVLYSPVVLLDGEYLGWNPVFSLRQFDHHEPLSEPLAHDELLRAANIDSGAANSVVVALPQLPTGRLLGLRIDVLPAELQSLSDDIRSHIVGVGRATPAGPGGIQTIVDYIRSHIVGVGRADFHPGVLGHVAERVVASLEQEESFDPDELEALAEQASQEALVAGASLIGDPTATGDSCGVVAIDPAFHNVTTAHFLQICRSSDRALPDSPSDVEHHLAISRDGREMMVMWQDGDGLSFVRSQGSTWSREQQLNLPPGIGLNDALQALEQQIRTED